MGQKLRVVVADDDTAVRGLVGTWLEHLGHDVTKVCCGTELLAVCREAPPELVVSGVRLLPPDGLAAAAVLRAELGIPVVLMSGDWDEDRAARADDLHVPRLSKPFHRLDLVRAIADARAASAPPRRTSGIPVMDDRPGSEVGDAVFHQFTETVANVAVFTLDPAGRVSHWNRGAARLFGYEPREIIGLGWERLFSAGDRAAGVPAEELAAAAADGTVREGGWHPRPDGTEFWAGGSLTALRDAGGNLVGYGKIVRDLTDQKKREAALHAASAALREADAQRTTFLTTLAHELRNPLAPILTYAHVLRLHPTAADAAGIADKIERQVRQLVRLVDDLTDTARVCQGKVALDRRRVDLRTVVGQAAEGAAPRCEAAGHALYVTLPPDPVWLDADPDRLAQVVSNLVGNAIKYTPEPGRIGVTVEAADGHATLRVRDTGLGIAPDRLTAVFELFTQDDRHRAHAQGGLGVGLAVVRELVARHGGTTHAASDGDGCGSEFVVRLPVAEACCSSLTEAGV